MRKYKKQKYKNTRIRKANYINLLNIDCLNAI